MIKTDEIQDPNSCLNQAQFDEPLFVLRANDELAPAAIRDWAKRYAQSKSVGSNPPGMTDAQKGKHAEALSVADRMEAWHRNFGKP